MKKIASWLRAKASPQAWFVFVALIFGSVFVLLTPPFLGGDELFHFTRAYQVANGELVAPKTANGTGDEVPVSVLAVHSYIDAHHSRPQHLLFASLGFPLNPQSTTYVSFPSAAVNNPAMYIPQALAIKAGLLVEAPPAAMMYMARMANLVFYVAVIYLAIRIIPFGKVSMMAFALFPMHIVSASSASADTFTLAMIALFAAALLYYRSRTERLTPSGIFLFMMLVAGMSLTKLPGPVFLLLMPLIPPRVLGGTRNAWFGLLGAAAAVALLCCVTWMWIVSITLTPYGPAGVDVAQQLQFILHHPLHFLGAAFTTYTTHVSNAATLGALVSLSPPGTVFPAWLTVGYGVFTALILPITATATQVWRRWEKWLLTGCIALFLIGIAGLLYLSWTPVGSTQVEGLQPRYLTPLLFLLIPLCAIPHVITRLRLRWMYLVPVFFLAYTAFITLRGFYL
jgi:uncharacterized membrane protein